jgi:tetratricopeptide (TPR) repeat protein
MTKKILLAFLVILSCSGIVRAQCTTYSLYGTLIIPVRDHPEKFEVLLTVRMGEQIVAYSYIDMTGRFFFDNLAGGEYDVVVRIEGFKELRERVLIDAHSGANPDNGGCKNNQIYWLTPEDVTVVVDERLRGYPKEAISEYVLAVTANTEKRYKEVVVHLENTVRLAPDWFDAHCELGAAYEQVSQFNNAEKQYRRALELKPDGMRAMMSLGRLLVLEADEKIQDPASRDGAAPILKEAREVLIRAGTRDPKEAMAAYLLGAVDFRLASYANAENELKHALELDATIFPARVTLINVYIEQKQWQNALDNVDTFIIENPDTVYRQQVLAIRSSILRRLPPSQ